MSRECRTTHGESKTSRPVRLCSARPWRTRKRNLLSIEDGSLTVAGTSGTASDIGYDEDDDDEKWTVLETSTRSTPSDGGRHPAHPSRLRRRGCASARLHRPLRRPAVRARRREEGDGSPLGQRPRRRPEPPAHERLPPHPYLADTRARADWFEGVGALRAAPSCPSSTHGVASRAPPTRKRSFTRSTRPPDSPRRSERPSACT